VNVATVLIADDAAFMRMRSASLLTELGHEVFEAEDGQEALIVYKEKKPDAVLLDITMPVMDGLEALKAIMEFDPDAKVAMVTAMGQQQVIMEAIKTGAKDFVVKPFDSERIQEALWKLIG
jgi:two-component system, chemotaxis family, chemotaxis protein CheY